MRTSRTAGWRSMAAFASAGAGPSSSMTVNASDPRRVRYMRAVAMFTAQSEKQPAMCASTPVSSRWRTTTLVCSPVTFTSMPSMRVTTAAPPPTLTPRTSSAPPSASTMRASTVLGCSTAASRSQQNEKASPAACARSNESRTPRSSGSRPKRPAMSALSVPWPDCVCANEPYSVNSARTGAAASRLRAMRAMRSAPAVWELEGPTMMGPTMSANPNVSMRVLSCAVAAGLARPPSVRPCVRGRGKAGSGCPALIGGAPVALPW